MDRQQKILLLIITGLYLVEFSALERTPPSSNERYNEVDSNGKFHFKPEVLSVLRRGDIRGFRGLINKGALKNYGAQIDHYDYHKQKRLENMMNQKMFSVEGLLAIRLATVPSEDFLRKNSNDGRLFNITILPDTDLIVPLFLNLDVFKTLNETITKGMRGLPVICSVPDIELRIVKYILDSGEDINDRSMMNYCALDMAALAGNIKVVKFLVENGADPNNIIGREVDENHEANFLRFVKIFSPNDVTIPPSFKVHHSPLIFAIHEEQIDIVKYLLKVGADVNVDHQSWSTLMGPVTEGKTEMLEVLLQHGIDIEGRDVFGATALHMAADGGRLEVAKLLLKYGADATAMDNFGMIPLHVAALAARNIALLNLLLSANRSLVHAPTYRGFTPLNLAEAGSDPWFYVCLSTAVARNFSTDKKLECRQRVKLCYHEEHVDIIILLLNSGSSVNHQDDILGWTTLHWAAAIGDFKVAKLLVENYGANVSIKSKVGMTPSETATYFGKPELSQYLKGIRST